MIPIGSLAVHWLEKYTSVVRPEFICGRDEGVLFLSRYGDAISTNNLTTLVGGYVEQSKIGKKGACHLFRHSMATLMLENGADIRFIQAMLGHVSLNTTEMYTQVSIKKLKEVHSLTHPAQHGRTRFVDSADVEPTEETLFAALESEDDEDTSIH
jgi:integrase/recombinase XerD